MAHSRWSDCPFRIGPDDPAIPAILDLIRAAFAYMEGRIDPPSSMHRLTLDDIARQARDGEVWCIGQPPIACVFLTPMDNDLYIGKLAVTAERRGEGFARSLVDVAAERARELGRNALTLQTRIELVENHAVFRRMGFAPLGMTAHPGYDRPTSVTMRRAL